MSFLDPFDIGSSLGIGSILDPAGFTLKAMQKGTKSLKKKLMPQIPAAAPATQLVMPEADDAAVAAARRRKVAAMQQRGGRSSTILSTDDRLGG